jgi:hypothetical protein
MADSHGFQFAGVATIVDGKESWKQFFYRSPDVLYNSLQKDAKALILETGTANQNTYKPTGQGDQGRASMCRARNGGTLLCVNVYTPVKPASIEVTFTGGEERVCITGLAIK